MNRLFSKSEIYSLKDSSRKKKKAYTYHTDNPVNEEEIRGLNNFYNAVLGIEKNMNKSKQEKTLK